MRIFISYPNKNRHMAKKVVKLCEAHGHDPFVAYQDIAPKNGIWFSEICKQIDLADAFILCLDSSSFDAPIQKKEWDYVVIQKKIILVIHSGPWNKDYNQPDFFPSVGPYQHCCLEKLEECRLAIKSLKYPYQDRFDFMQNLVIEAGTQLMLKYGLRFLTGKPIPIDKRKNYATDIDVTVQSFITEQICRKYPNELIVAEESDIKPSSQKSESAFIWTVDPLDGTLNYISGDEHYCCGIGLIHHNKPCLGVIFVPSRMELYTGGEGRLAERRFISEGGNEKLQTDRSVHELDLCNVITHINSEPENIDLCFKNDFPKRLHHSVRRVWMWGCGLLSLVAISRGSFHLFVQRKTYPWDVVPGLAILRAAGGVDSIWPYNIHEPWTLDKWETNPGIVAACNKRLLKAFLERFRGIKR